MSNGFTSKNMEASQLSDQVSGDKVSFRFFRKRQRVRLTDRNEMVKGPMLSEEILEKINRSALKFLEPLSLKDVYRVIVREAIKLVHGKDGLILLNHDGLLKSVYASSKAAAIVKPRKRGYAYTCFKKRSPILIHTFKIDDEDFIKSHPELKRNRVKSAVFIPLSYRRKAIGVLSIRSDKEEHFTERELNILTIFGSMASLAIRKVQLHTEIQQALRTRDLFLSMAAHELKTPLTTISGYIQLLQNKLRDTTTSEGRWVHELSIETRRLVNLVNELLQINTIKSGKLQYSWKECSLRDIIRQAIASYRFAYPNRLVFFEDQLKVGTDTVVGDMDKLKQVFDNLLGNAGKYSGLDSPIEISLSGKPEKFIIQVQDRGIGIPRKDLPHVFDEFYKVENKDHIVEGMGLGLFLVKTMILQHHGSISIDSKRNIGTKVTIELPRSSI
jgi:signal transduction histidine kinase